MNGALGGTSEAMCKAARACAVLGHQLLLEKSSRQLAASRARQTSDCLLTSDRCGVCGEDDEPDDDVKTCLYVCILMKFYSKSFSNVACSAVCACGSIDLLSPSVRGSSRRAQLRNHRVFKVSPYDVYS